MLISKNQFDLYDSEEIILLSEQIRYLKSFINQEDNITIFLSHKHSEKELLRKVIAFLKSYGANIYLDWEDSEMPKKTSGETAERIKKMIKNNRKFVFVASEGAISSKWCNWELGHGDSLKYHKNIAILPITENNGDWNGSEYLQIYPIIKSNYNELSKGCFVEFKGVKTELKTWLNN